MLGFAASTGDPRPADGRGQRGAERTISTAKYEVTGRGGMRRELRQRGQFTRVIYPIPTPRSRSASSVRLRSLGVSGNS